MLAGSQLRRPALPALLAVLALAVLGAVVVARFHVWADIDERAHYAYVQTVAEERRLPAITDPVSPEVQAISDRSWPSPSPVDPRTQGLAGRNYEAFQPPLYYLAAAPAFALVADHRDKIFAVRAFDLVLYLAGAALLWLLACRLVPRPRAPAVWTAGLLVLAWPGLLVRGVTVSNAALEFLVVPAFLLAAWAAHRSPSPGRLLAAAALLGACLLTKGTLVVLAPVLVLAALRTWRRSPAAVLASAALPALMLAPWLIDNRSRFGTWTANAAAREQQTPALFPGGVPDWGLSDLPGRLANLLAGSLPQEWEGQLDVWWVGIGARLLVLVLLAAVAVALLRSPHRRTVAFFALPVACGLAMMVVTLLGEEWDIFLLRYLGPLLPPLAVATAAAIPPRRLRAGSIATAILVAALWVDMAGAYLFTEAGDALGI